jgi:hypothetical protein
VSAVKVCTTAPWQAGDGGVEGDRVTVGGRVTAGRPRGLGAGGVRLAAAEVVAAGVGDGAGLVVGDVLSASAGNGDTGPGPQAAAGTSTTTASTAAAARSGAERRAISAPIVAESLP